MQRKYVASNDNGDDDNTCVRIYGCVRLTRSLLLQDTVKFVRRLLMLTQWCCLYVSYNYCIILIWDTAIRGSGALRGREGRGHTRDRIRLPSGNYMMHDECCTRVGKTQGSPLIEGVCNFCGRFIYEKDLLKSN